MNSAAAYSGFHHPGPPTPAVRTLLTINVVSFLIGQLGGERGFYDLFGLTVPDVFSHFRIYQFVTYLFVHGGTLHLLFNMLILFFFGRALEAYWGTRYFLRYYFISGIGAGICSIPFIWGEGVPLVGASGALFALLIAFGVLFPDRVVTFLLFFVIPVRMRARQMVVIFVGLELLFLLNRDGGGGIAHFAHLGGALVGFLYLQWPRWRQSIFFRKHPVEPRISYREELDAVLEKLAREGWGGLSEEERGFLHDSRHNL